MEFFSSRNISSCLKQDHAQYSKRFCYKASGPSHNNDSMDSFRNGNADEVFYSDSEALGIMDKPQSQLRAERTLHWSARVPNDEETTTPSERSLPVSARLQSRISFLGRPSHVLRKGDRMLLPQENFSGRGAQEKLKQRNNYKGASPFSDEYETTTDTSFGYRGPKPGQKIDKSCLAISDNNERHTKDSTYCSQKLYYSTSKQSKPVAKTMGTREVLKEGKRVSKKGMTAQYTNESLWSLKRKKDDDDSASHEGEYVDCTENSGNSSFDQLVEINEPLAILKNKQDTCSKHHSKKVDSVRRNVRSSSESVTCYNSGEYESEKSQFSGRNKNFSNKCAGDSSGFTGPVVVESESFKDVASADRVNIKFEGRTDSQQIQSSGQLEDSMVKFTKDLEDGVNYGDLGSGNIHISETLSKLSILDLVTVLKRPEMTDCMPQNKDLDNACQFSQIILKEKIARLATLLEACKDIIKNNQAERELIRSEALQNAQVAKECKNQVDRLGKEKAKSDEDFIRLLGVAKELKIELRNVRQDLIRKEEEMRSELARHESALQEMLQEEKKRHMKMLHEEKERHIELEMQTQHELQQYKNNIKQKLDEAEQKVFQRMLKLEQECEKYMKAVKRKNRSKSTSCPDMQFQSKRGYHLQESAIADNVVTGGKSLTIKSSPCYKGSDHEMEMISTSRDVPRHQSKITFSRAKNYLGKGIQFDSPGSESETAKRGFSRSGPNYYNYQTDLDES